MSTFFQVLASLAVLLVPGLTKYVQNLPENTRCFVFGLCMGVVGGWWACHFLANNQSKRDKAEAEKITAETARRAEENTERQRQWERDRMDRLEAEEKAAKEAERKFQDSFLVVDGKLVDEEGNLCCPECRNKCHKHQTLVNDKCPRCGWVLPFHAFDAAPSESFSDRRYF